MQAAILHSFSKASKFNYKVEVKDNEDKVIDKKKIKVDLQLHCQSPEQPIIGRPPGDHPNLQLW